MLQKIKKILGENNGLAPVFLFSLVVFFWTIFDSMMQYITPLLIEEQGFSNSMIGIIIGTSSITGALFDFSIAKVFKNKSFRLIFLSMFVICFFYPLLLWQAKTTWFFLFVMAVWGVYFDLYGFGVFNFVGRYTKKAEHSSSFGVIQMFRSLGSALAPFIIGLVIADTVDWRSFSLGWFFLSLGFVFFIVLNVIVRQKQSADQVIVQTKKRNFFVELHLWKKLGRTMLPVLSLTMYLFFIEAFFWTLAPLYIESSNLGQFKGLFLTAYTVPPLIIGWFIGSLTKHFGKKEPRSPDY